MQPDPAARPTLASCREPFLDLFERALCLEASSTGLPGVTELPFATGLPPAPGVAPAPDVVTVSSAPSMPSMPSLPSLPPPPRLPSEQACAWPQND